MIINLKLSDDTTVGDLITKLFPNMYFTEKYKNLMTKYFEDIKIKRNIWDEKLDWDSLKDNGIAAKEQEPILNKIRAEIEELDYITFDGITKRRCLEIIDRYKAESEEA